MFSSPFLWVVLWERGHLHAWPVLVSLFDLSVCSFAFFSAADTCKVYFKPFDKSLALCDSSSKQSINQPERCWSPWLPPSRIFPSILLVYKIMVLHAHFCVIWTCVYICMYLCLYIAHSYRFRKKTEALLLGCISKLLNT